MTPISALAILFCIYAVSELIAQKTKAIFSTVLSIAILLLAGFWSGILPRTLIDDAQITGFGNIIAGLLIVSLGTTIDFAELRRQWKVVVTALCGVCGAVSAIVLIGRPFIGSEMAIAGAPIFAGGSAATLIMTSTLKEMNLTTAATFCIVLYVTQKFIGVPIASLLLRRTAKLIRDDAVLVEQYSTLQEENAAAHHGSAPPAEMLRASFDVPRQACSRCGHRVLCVQADRRRGSLLRHVPDHGRGILRTGLSR